MAALEKLALLSPEYLEKLEQIRAAVAHHVYEEESDWLIELKDQASLQDQTQLGEHYAREYDRYTGADKVSTKAVRHGSAGR